MMRKKIFVIALSVMMALAFMPCIAFAENANGMDQVSRAVTGDQTIERVAGVAEEGVAAAQLGDTSGVLKGEASGSIAVNSVTSPSKIYGGTWSTVSIDRGDEQEMYYGGTQEVTLKKGVVGVYAAMTSNSTDKYAWSRIGIYYDSTCTQEVDGYMFVSEKDSANKKDCIGYFEIPEAGTYYIDISAVYSANEDDDDWCGATHMDVLAMINQYAQAKSGTSLTAGKVYGVVSNAGGAISFKFKTTKKGGLNVETDDYTITKLLSSSGKLLGTQANKNYTPYFGVKKAVTYKLSVKTPASTYNGGYLIYVKNTAVTNKSGATKKKAATLKKGTAKKGLITAGSTKAQWFKLKTTKKAKIKFTFKGNTNNKFKLEFYKGGTKLTKWTSSYRYKDRSVTVTAKSKMPKGTYYVKVTPVNKSSGWYSVKWTYK